MFEICNLQYLLFFTKKQNWEKFKSKLTFTHISALRFWINNIVLKTKKLLEYTIINQKICTITMRTTYEHWFVYLMIENTAWSINWAKTGHSIVRFEVSSATRTVQSKTGRVVSLALCNLFTCFNSAYHRLLHFISCYVFVRSLNGNFNEIAVLCHTTPYFIETLL